jgi:hypothetical protein
MRTLPLILSLSPKSFPMWCNVKWSSVRYIVFLYFSSFLKTPWFSVPVLPLSLASFIHVFVLWIVKNFHTFTHHHFSELSWKIPGGWIYELALLDAQKNEMNTGKVHVGHEVEGVAANLRGKVGEVGVWFHILIWVCILDEKSLRLFRKKIWIWCFSGFDRRLSGQLRSADPEAWWVREALHERLTVV